MNLNYQILEVQILSDYKLLLTFSSGEQKVFDVQPYLEKGIFKELKENGLFFTAKVSFDTVEWENGADFDPEFLYEESNAFVREENILK